jgi:hypothetical protein
MFVYRGVWGVFYTNTPRVNNRNEVKVQVSGVKLEIKKILMNSASFDTFFEDKKHSGRAGGKQSSTITQN